jgi:hypothetical protein
MDYIDAEDSGLSPTIGKSTCGVVGGLVWPTFSVGGKISDECSAWN